LAPSELVLEHHTVLDDKLEVGLGTDNDRYILQRVKSPIGRTRIVELLADR